VSILLPRKPPTGDAWNQDQFVSRFKGCVHILQVFDVVFSDEKVNEWAQLLFPIKQMRFQGRILCDQVLDRIPNRISLDFDD
jgi:hypothetical protein